MPIIWELYRRGVLPQETRNYVPIILAVTIMAKNPSQYGLEHVTLDPAPQVDQVIIDYPVDLRLVAECVDTSVNYLQELNPSLLRMTTPKGEPFTLQSPRRHVADQYQTAIAAIPRDMRTLWRYHRVESGDTLASVAHKVSRHPGRHHPGQQPSGGLPEGRRQADHSRSRPGAKRRGSRWPFRSIHPLQGAQGRHPRIRWPTTSKCRSIS